MRKISILFMCVAIVGAVAAEAGETRTLEAAVDLGSLTTVALEAGVGDVTITAGPEPVIRATVHLKPRRGGLFASMRTAERQVREARLEPRISGDTLALEISAVDNDRRFQEDWTITLPAHLMLELELGVGDLMISGTDGDLELEIGVGDAVVDVFGGSMEVEVGVGGISIKAPATLYDSVEAETGVGDASIRIGDQTIAGEGFVSHSAEWQGSGSFDIEAESGVGDVRIVLN